MEKWKNRLVESMKEWKNERMENERTDWQNEWMNIMHEQIEWTEISKRQLIRRQRRSGKRVWKEETFTEKSNIKCWIEICDEES